MGETEAIDCYLANVSPIADRCAMHSRLGQKSKASNGGLIKPECPPCTDFLTRVLSNW